MLAWPVAAQQEEVADGAVWSRAALVGQFESAVRKVSGGSDDALAFMMKLAAGRLKTCPAPSEGPDGSRSG